MAKDEVVAVALRPQTDPVGLSLRSNFAQLGKKMKS